MTPKELKKALNSGQRVYGTMIASPSPKWVPYVSKLGLDFVFLDTEHIPLDRSTLSWMCHAYRGAGLTPIVRIPSPDPYEACMAMDGGAGGVVAPYLETMEQVRELRGAVKYRPLKGKRLQRVLSGEEELSAQEKEYMKAYSQDALLILNIESRTAIDQLDDLLSEPDIDAVFIGPHDLSVNLGIPEAYDSESWNQSCLEIIHKCKAKGIAVANHFSDNIEMQLLWARAGMNMVLWNADVIRMYQALNQDFTYIKKELGDQTKTSVERMDL